MNRRISLFFRLLFARGEKAKTKVRRSEAQLRRKRQKKSKAGAPVYPNSDAPRSGP